MLIVVAMIDDGAMLQDFGRGHKESERHGVWSSRWDRNEESRYREQIF